MRLAAAFALMRKATVELDFNGKKYQGFYAVHAGMLTVWNRSMGSRSIQILDQPVSTLAQALLLEVILDCRQKPGLGRYA